MTRLGAIALLPFTLAGCTCGLAFDFDAGYACMKDADCARGFACFDGVCATSASPNPDGGPLSDAGMVLSGGIVFTTPPRSVVIGVCSPQVGFQLLDDAGMPLDAPMDLSVAFSASPAPGLAFFTDAMCTTQAAGMLVLAGSSTGALYFVGSTAGDYGLALSSLPLDGALQTQTLNPVPMDQLKLTPPQGAQLEGTCIGPITVERDDPSGAPDPAPAQGLDIRFTVSDAGLTLFSDSQCSNDLGLGPLTLSSGSSQQTFWASGPASGTFTVMATAPSTTSASFDEQLLPLVQRGSCDLNNGQASRTCNVSPGLLDTSSSFLVYQATGQSLSSQNSEVSCTLMSTSSVFCQRGQNHGDVKVVFQTVELQDAQVDRYPSGCPGQGLTQMFALNNMVPATDVFELVSTNASGDDFNANDLFSVLNDGANITLQWEQGCNASHLEIQVVHVLRLRRLSPHGHTAFTGGFPTAITPTAACPSPTEGVFVLNTWRNNSSTSGPTFICDRTVRAEVTSSTEVTVTRTDGNSDPNCVSTDITGYVLDRIDTGPRADVQQVVVKLAQGTTTAMHGINPVNLERAFVLASGESGGFGQAVGEGALGDAGSGYMGDISALVQLQSPTQVQVTRGTSYDAAAFTVYVVELVP